MAPVQEVSSDVGEIVRRDNMRRLEINREKGVIRMGASATGVSLIALEAVIPENAPEGQVFATTITQRNQYGQVCGGVTVMHVVKRQG